MTTKASLYDHLSPAAIRSVTEHFYQKVLSDDLLAPYFRDVGMRRLVAMQAAFLTKAFGGPDVYKGRDLRQAHAGLTGLDDQHFDKVLGHLAQSLREAGVAQAAAHRLVVLGDGAEFTVVAAQPLKKDGQLFDVIDLGDDLC